MNETLFIPYGFVKIQKLPFDLWKKIRNINTKDDFISFLKENKDLISEFIGTKDRNNIFNKNTLNWSSIKYIYGILSSKILRGGGSNLTSWGLWCYTEGDVLEFQRINKSEKRILVIQNRIKFTLSPYILLIGGKYYKQLKESSQLIHHSIAGNTESIIESNKNANLYGIDKVIKEQSNNNRIKVFSNYKICGKVDYIVHINKNNELKFVPIDVNDLHGGLCWIDLFRRYYEQYFGEIKKEDHEILYYFVSSFISYYESVKGKPPGNILICLDDLERWNQDNGLNYIKIKEFTQEILKEREVDANISISYLENYKGCLANYKRNHKIEIQTIDEDDGSLSENFTDKIDLVVRIYRRLYDTKNNKFYTTREFLGKNPPFVIYDPEELRPAYYKENVHKIFQNIYLRDRLKDLVLLPDLIGVYSLKQKDLTNKIFHDVFEKGYDDFVIKLNEKTPYTNISAFFFSAKNDLHKLFLADTIQKLRDNVKDINNIIVEPLYGSGFLDDNLKIEIRTVNVQNLNI